METHPVVVCFEVFPLLDKGLTVTCFNSTWCTLSFANLRYLNILFSYSCKLPLVYWLARWDCHYCYQYFTSKAAMQSVENLGGQESVVSLLIWGTVLCFPSQAFKSRHQLLSWDGDTLWVMVLMAPGSPFGDNGFLHLVLVWLYLCG